MHDWRKARWGAVFLPATKVCATTALIGYLASGCSSAPKLDDGHKQAARYLDVVAMHVERYGTATISTPLLIEGNNSLFEFGLGKDANSYFQDAQKHIQGREVVSEQSLLSLAGSAEVAVDPTQRAAYAEAFEQYQRDMARINERNALIDSAAAHDYFAALTDASHKSEPERSKAIADAERAYAGARSAPSTDKPLPPVATSFAPQIATDASLLKQADPSKVFSNSDKAGAFRDPGDLLKLPNLLPQDAPLSISDRSAIITAAGDTTVAGIFKAIGQPERALQFSNRRAFFGIAMVAVTPGHKTREGFAADLAVTTDVTLHPATPATTLKLFERQDLDPELKVVLARNMNLPLSLAIEKQLEETRTARAVLVQHLSAWQCEDGKRWADWLDRVGIIQAALVGTLKRPIATQGEACELLATLRGRTSERELRAPIPAELYGGDLTHPEVLGLTRGSTLEECGQNHDGDGQVCYWFDGRYAPTLAAVSPMTETQVLDQGSSYRDRRQVALSLAAALQSAGKKEQGNFFAEYAKQLEGDIATRTSQNLVTGYSSGSAFGYQIGPALEALENPSGKRSQSAEVLQRQSFPVLLIFGVDNVNSGPRIYTEKCEDGSQCLRVWQPYLRLRQQTRWVPTRGFPFRPWKRESEENAARYAAAVAAIRAECPLSGPDTTKSGNKDNDKRNYDAMSTACRYMRRRVDVLATLLTEGSSEIELPALSARSARLAKVTTLVPQRLPAFRPGEVRKIIVLGDDLDIVKSASFVAGSGAGTVEAIPYGKGALELTITAKEAVTPPIAISLTSDDGVGLATQVNTPVVLLDLTSSEASVRSPNKAKK